MNYLKEWAGMGALAGLMVLVSVVCLWCLRQNWIQRNRDTAMIAQAFMAVKKWTVLTSVADCVEIEALTGC